MECPVGGCQNGRMKNFKNENLNNQIWGMTDNLRKSIHNKVFCGPRRSIRKNHIYDKFYTGQVYQIRVGILWDQVRPIINK